MSAAHTPMVVAAARALCAIGAKKSGLDQEAYWAAYSDSLTVEAAAVLNAVGAPEMLAALQVSKQFIRNGIEFGFIRMPDADCPDPAHNTPKLIDAAIAKATGGAQ